MGDIYREKNPSLTSVDLKGDSLPSKGMLYDLESEGKGWTLNYRPYTLGEVKKLSQSNLSYKDKLLMALDGVEASFDKRSITLSDLVYISLLRRISSFGNNGFIVGSVCPKCGEKSESKVFEESMEAKDIEAKALPITVKDKSGTEFKFVPLTIGRFLDILQAGQQTEDLRLMAGCCVSHDPDDAFNMFESMDQNFGKALQQVDKYLDHNMLDVEVKCTNLECGHKKKVKPVGGQALLLPFRGNKDDTDFTISFG